LVEKPWAHDQPGGKLFRGAEVKKQPGSQAQYEPGKKNSFEGFDE